MKPKVLVIVGPTSSGKTSLSLQLAKQWNGEVISADSRQVYRGLNLVSGKVTEEEMDGVPHHLLDVADPMTVYTVKDFVAAAAAAILDIHNRGRLPIVAGGTFLYTDALLGRISVPEVPPNETLRRELETKTTDELVRELRALDPARAASIDQDNPRRLIRAIEIARALGAVPPLQSDTPYDPLILGIDIDQAKLHHNIHVRLEERLKAGMLAEVAALVKKGVTHERLESLGLECRYLSRHLRGEMTLENAIAELEVKTRQFAKRQKTWLKRDQDIHWVQPTDTNTITTLVDKFLKS